MSKKAVTKLSTTGLAFLVSALLLTLVLYTVVSQAVTLDPQNAVLTSTRYGYQEGIVRLDSGELIATWADNESDIWCSNSLDNGTTWNSTELISAGTFLYPSIVTNGTRVVIAMRDNDAAQQDIMVAYSDNGCYGTFTFVDVPGMTVDVSFPSMILGPDGTFYMCAIERADDLKYSYSADGFTWANAIEWDSTDNDYCDIAVDSNGMVWIAHGENAGGTATFDIEVVNSSDHFTSYTNVIVADGTDYTFPSIAVGNNDEIYLAWETGTLNTFYFANSSDGVAWTVSPVTTSDVLGSGDVNLPVVKVNANSDELYVFFEQDISGDDYAVFYANSSNEGFSWFSRLIGYSRRGALTADDVQHINPRGSKYPVSNNIVDRLDFMFSARSDTVTLYSVIFDSIDLTPINHTKIEGVYIAASQYIQWVGRTVLRYYGDYVYDFTSKFAPVGTTTTERRWQKIRCLEKREKCILVSQSSDNDVHFEVLSTNNGSWHSYTELSAAAPDVITPRFDVECEDLSGECLVIYDQGPASADREVEYRVYSGGVLQSPVQMNLSAANSTQDWIKLFPKEGSNDIMVSVEDGARDLNLMLWNGTSNSFASGTHIRPVTTTPVADRRTHSFSWEGQSGEGLLFYGISGSNAINAYLFNHTRFGWSNLGAVNITEMVGGNPYWITSCGSDPNGGGNSHDNIGILVKTWDSVQSYTYGFIWNGTGIEAGAPTYDSTTEQLTSTEKIQCRWEANSGNQSVFMWLDLDASRASYATYTIGSGWDISSFGSGNQSGLVTFVGQIEDLIMIENPNTDELMVVGRGSTNNVNCMVWDGSAFVNQSCSYNQPLESASPTTDSSYNSFDYYRFDRKSPGVIITSPINGSIVNVSAVGFNVSLDESGRCNYSLSNGAVNFSMTGDLAGFNFNATNSSIADGSYSFRVYCYDVVGNRNESESSSFFVDGYFPLISFGVGTANDSANFSRNWVYVNISIVEANEVNVTFRLFNSFGLINQSIFGAGVRQINWTSLADGFYYYNVSVCDISGKCNFTSTRAIGLDDTAPTISIFHPEARTYSTNQSLPLNVSVSDNLIGLNSCWWNLDGGVNNSIVCGQNTTFNVSVDGSHTIYFYSNDSLNNIGSASVEFFVSANAPGITLESPPIFGYLNYSQNIELNYTPRDSQGLGACSLFGNWSGGWHLNQTDFSPQNYSLNSFNINLAQVEASYLWNVRCNDSDGVESYSPLNHTILLDFTTPLIDFNGGTQVSGANLSQNWIFVNLTQYDNYGGNLTFRLFNITSLVNVSVLNSSYYWINWTNLAGGIYYYNVSFVDYAGNSNRTETREILLDYVAPNGTLLLPSNGSYLNNATQNFTINTTDDIGLNNLTVLVYNSTDGLVYNQTASVSGTEAVVGFVYNFVADGIFRWFYRIFDIAGNFFITENRTVTIDTIGPGINFTFPTENDGLEFERDWIFVNVSLEEQNFANVSFELYSSNGLVNRTVFNTAINELNWTNLEDLNVTYYYNVTVRDLAGNTNFTETRTIKLIDVSFPELDLISPSPRIYYTRDILLRINATDANLDSCRYVLNNGAVNGTLQSCSQSALTLNGDGQYFIEFFVNDSMGMVNYTNVSFNVSTSNLRPGILAYAENNNGAPKYRLWNGYMFSDELSANAVYATANDIQWIRAKSSSVREEHIIVTADDQDDINVQINSSVLGQGCWHNGTTCGGVYEVTGGSSAAEYLKADVAYESLSGDALIVWGDNDNSPNYMIWNGSGFGEITAIPQSRLSGIVSYMKLTSHPFRDEIALILTNRTDVSFNIWSGSSWSCELPSLFSTNLENNRQYQNVDPAYEQVSGDLFIAIAANGFNGFDYATKADGVCSYNFASSGAMSLESEIIAVSPQYGSNYILISQEDVGGDDVDNVVWDGTGFGAGSSTDASLSAETPQNRIMDVAFAGTSEIGLMVYADGDLSYYIDYFLYNKTSNSWSDNSGNGFNEGSLPPFLYYERNYRTYSFIELNRTMVLVHDTVNDLWAKGYDADYGEWLSYDNGTYLDDNLPAVSFPTFDFYFTYDIAGPYIIVNEPVGTYGPIVRFNVTASEISSVCLYSIDGGNNVSMNSTNNMTFYSVNSSVAGGNHNVTFSCFDKWSNLRSTTQNFTVDSTPPLIDYGFGTLDDGVNVSQTNVYVNVTVNESNEGNITFGLWNISSIVNLTTFGAGNRTINWTGLNDGLYYYNVTSYDLYGNSNTTTTRSIRLDRTAPNATLLAPFNASFSNNLTQNFTVNATDSNSLKNLTLFVYNSSNDLIYNASASVSGTEAVVGLVYSFVSDGIYYWFYRVFDIAGNWFDSENRTITIDRIIPLIDFGEGSGGTGVYRNRNWIYVNVSIEEVYENNVTFNLFNQTDKLSEPNYPSHAPAGANLLNNSFGTLQSLVATSSSTPANWGPDKLRDGYVMGESGYAWASGSGGTTNQNITINFTRAYDFDTIEIFEGFGTSYSASPRQTRVYVSSDGTNWNLVASKQLFGSVPTYLGQYDVINFTNQRFAFVRIEFVNNWGNPSFLGSNEIRIYKKSINLANASLSVLDEPTQTGAQHINLTRNEIVGAPYWLANGVSNVNLSWDFGMAKRTSYLEWYGSGDSSSLYPRNYRVYVSDDGVSYSYVSNGSFRGGAYGFVESINWREQNSRYLKLEIVDGYGASVRANEIKIWESTSAIRHDHNFTGLSDGIYFYNVSTSDKAGNVNSTTTRNITLDTITPLISFGSGTLLSGVNVSQSYIYVNVSVTEVNVANISFGLWNETSLVNFTTLGASLRTINWTGLPSTRYYYNVSIFDAALNYNFTETREINLDNIVPNGTLLVTENATITNNVTQNFTVNATDNIGLTNLTLFIYNSSNDLVYNQTASVSGTEAIVGLVYNFVTDGIYRWFYRIFDIAGNVFNTENRTITIDTVGPTILINSPIGNVRDVTPALNVSVSENVGRLWYNLNGGENVTLCTSCSGERVVFLNLYEGSFVLNVYANDSVGNVLANSSIFNVNMSLNYFDSFVDNSSIVQYNGVTWSSGNVSFTGGFLQNISYVSGSPQVNGSWKGVYGENGVILAGWAGGSALPWNTNYDSKNLSKIDSYSFTGNVFTWSSPTAELRAVENITGTTRRATTSYAPSGPLTFRLNTTILNYNLTFYILDWDTTARRENISIQSLDGTYQAFHYANYNFNGGRYVTFEIRGINSTVTTFTPLAGANAVVSGVFVDEIPSGESGSFVSYPINTAQEIIRITNVSWNEAATDEGNSIAVEVSADNGVNWYNATNGNGTDVARNTSLIYRVLFNTNSSKTISLLDMNISWEADLLAPNATLVLPSNGSYSSNLTQNFTVNASDNYGLGNLTLFIYNSTGELEYNQTTIVSGSKAFIGLVYNFIYDGVYRWFYGVFDVVGNFFASENRTLVIDTTKPGIYFGSGTEVSSVNRSRSWLFVNVSISELNEANVTFSLYNSSGVVGVVERGAGNRTYNWTNLLEDVYFYNVTVTDLAGLGNSTETREILLDDTPPAINIFRPFAGAYGYNTSIELNVSVSDNLIGLDSCWWNLDGGINNSIVCGQNTTFDTNESLHTVYFYANDSLNNVGVNSVIFNVILSAPAITLLVPSDFSVSNISFNKNFSFIPTDSDGIDTCELWGNWTGIWALNLTDNSISNASVNSFYVNLSEDGRYSWNVWCNDTLGLEAFSFTNFSFALDRVYPVVDFGDGTLSSGVNVSQSNVYVNLTINETNEANITFGLYNLTSLVNLTTRGAGNRTLNWTGLADGKYFYNVSVVDQAGQRNFTETRMITLDILFPLISFGNGTANDGINVSRNWIYVNVSVSEVNEFNITFELYNSTSVVNVSSFGPGVRRINWTGLAEDTYFYYVTVSDVMYRTNTTATRKITLDRTAPSASLISPANATFTNQTLQNFTVNATDSYFLKNLTLFIYNSTNGFVYNATASVSGTEAVVGLVYNFVTDGIYRWFYRIFDITGNVFNTDNRTITIDRVYPIISFGNGTFLNGANVSRSNVYVNVSITELNVANVTFGLWNTTSLVNLTTLGANARTINWTGLSDGNYYYNVSVTDLVGFVNFTETRSINLDTQATGVILNTPVFGSSVADVTPTLNVTLGETVNALWYSVNNGANVSVCLNCGGERTAFLYLREGNFTVRVFANDPAGNVGVNSTNFIVNMSFNYFDSFNDNSSIVSYNGVLWNAGNVSFSGASNGISYVAGSPQVNGSWNGTYGRNGVIIPGWFNGVGSTLTWDGTTDLKNLSSINSYPILSGNSYKWLDSSSDVRAIINLTTSDRKAVTAYDSGSFSFNLNVSLSDYNVTFYFLDWDRTGRRQTVNVTDRSGIYKAGHYLNYDFGGGVYVTFEVHKVNFLNITVTQMAVTNAVLSGIFVDALPSSASGNFTAYPITTTHEIVQILNASWTTDNTDSSNNISVQLSVDNGTNWYNAINGQGISGFSRNNSLVYRVLFAMNSSNTISILDMNLSWKADFVAPNASLFLPLNASYSNNLTQNFSVNASDDYGLKNLSLLIYNSTNGLVYNQSTSVSGSEAIVGLVYNFIRDGIYRWFYRVFDLAGNLFVTENRTITIDTTLPGVNFGVGTAVDFANVSRSNIYVNVTVTEINEANVTFGLWNATSLVNLTTLGVSARTINWTGLSDGNYYYNVSVTDLAGNVNSSLTRKITLDTNAPAILLEFPAHRIGDNDGNITFGYNVSFDDLRNCSLIVNSRLNQTNFTIAGNSSGQFILSNLFGGAYYWSVNCTDAAGNVGNSSIRKIVVILSNGFDGEVTNFSMYDPENITNFTLEKTGYGKIIYLESINLSGGANLSSLVFLGNNLSGVNSNAERRLNKSANILIYNLSFASTPVVLRDRNLCPNSICSVNYYSGGNFSFNVTGFSNYSATANSNLTIWDTTDSTTKYEFNQVYFYANYINKSSGVSINGTGIYCNVSFNVTGDWDAWQEMIFNSSSRIYWFNRTFDNNGTYSWRVNCNVTDLSFEPITVYNAVNITSDTIWPLIDFGVRTLADGVNVSQSNVFVNVTVTEINEANITFGLWNLTDPVNVTTFYSAERVINWTGLADGIYYYNVSVTDLVSHVNSTATRRITLDSNAPNATLITPANATLTNNVTQNFTVNVTDNIGLKNLTLYIYNSTNGLVYNATASVSGTEAVVGLVYNFVTDGIYRWFYRVFDIAGNAFNSENRTVTIDTLAARVMLNSPENASVTSNSDVYFIANFSDVNGLVNSTLFVWNSTGDLVNQISRIISGVVNSTNISVVLPRIDVYHWNYYACDNLSNCEWNGANWSLSYEFQRVGLQLVYPLGNLEVLQNKFFNVSLNVSCLAGTCGEVNVSLDPIGYVVEVFNQTGNFNFTVPEGVTKVDVLVVAGGGSGGSHLTQGTATGAGGGGAGGLNFTANYSVTPGQNISGFVGAGGVAPSNGQGNNGGNSSFGIINVTGGGGGGFRDAGGRNGGSGGGGGYSSAGGTGISGQGYAGGTGTTDFGGSGGGGAGEVGESGNGDAGRTGGDGRNFTDIFGSEYGDNGWFAGGGGGGGRDTAIGGIGGLGGGGTGGVNSNGIAALAGTGGGGGGSGDFTWVGGNGGSGIVLVRYRYEKSGLIPVGSGAPFYTNLINPRNISLGSGQSQVVTFYVNATGSVGDYEFFAFANMTSNMSVSNITYWWNVSIVLPSPPGLTIISPLAQSYNFSQAIHFNVTGNENLSVCKFTLNNWQTNYTMTQFNATYFNYTNSSMRDGNYLVRFWCEDLLGTANSTESVNFTIDFNGPNASLILPSNGSYLSNATQNFTVNASDSVGLRNLTLYIYNSTNDLVYNQTASVSGTEVVVGLVYNFLTDGIYTWFYRIFDIVGRSFDSGNRTITIDTTKPGIYFGEGTESSGTNFSRDWIYVNVTINEINEANVSFRLYNVSGTVNVTTLGFGNRTFNWTGLADGLYYYNVTVTDLANNRNSTETRTLRIDTTAPLVRILYPTNGTYSQNISSLNFTVVDQTLDSCWYSLDGGATNISTPCGQNIMGVNAGNGQHNWTIWANDSFGKVNFDTVSFLVNEDIPTVTILYPLNTTYDFVVGSLNYSVIDPELDSCWYSINGGLNQSVTCNQNITGLSANEGSNHWAVFANDSSGLDGMDEVYFVIDTTPPRISVLSPLNITYAPYTIHFNVSGSEPLGYCAVSWDNWATNHTMTQFNSTYYYYTNNSLTPNNYLARFWCNDTIGNVNGTERVNFSVAFPQVGLSLVYPTSTINVTRYNFFNFTVNVSCGAVDCGHINVSLDPEVESILVYNVSGNFTVPEGVTKVDVLVVGGGGAGGSHVNYVTTSTGAGGGGAGGLNFTANYSVTPGQVINITVGIGGISPATNGPGQDGGNSSFGAISVVGGGGGGYRAGGGRSGGSGGGGGYDTTGGSGIAGQGYAGGTGTNDFGGSGGGGAGEVGESGVDDNGRMGGDGQNFTTVFGSSYGNNGWFAGGGGGGGRDLYSGGTGGLGGGGTGGVNSNGTNGINGTGGGGGGAGDTGNRGGNGGSGVVIVKYRTSVKSGLVPVGSGDPFYTNASNPRTISLNASQSRIVTFWVNATGTARTYEFFAFANLTSNLSLSNITGKVNVSIVVFDFVNPIVNLIYPYNASYFGNTIIPVFNFSVSELNIDSCVLYGNWSGGWHANQTIELSGEGSSNFSSVDVENDGTYIWNVWCNDTSGNAAFDSENFTFVVDTQFPLIEFTYMTENDGVNRSRDWVFVNVTVIESNFANLTFALYNLTGRVEQKVIPARIPNGLNLLNNSLGTLQSIRATSSNNPVNYGVENLVDNHYIGDATYAWVSGSGSNSNQNITINFTEAYLFDTIEVFQGYGTNYDASPRQTRVYISDDYVTWELVTSKQLFGGIPTVEGQSDKIQFSEIRKKFVKIEFVNNWGDAFMGSNEIRIYKSADNLANSSLSVLDFPSASNINLTRNNVLGESSYWQANATTNVNLTWDFGTEKGTSLLEWDGAGGASNLFPRNYRVYVSNDDLSYSFITNGTFVGGESGQISYVNWSEQNSRYLRLEIVDAYGSSIRANEIRIWESDTALRYYNLFEDLVDGLYYYNVSVSDLAGNTNSTETRSIRLDNIAPNVSLIYPVGENFSSFDIPQFNFSIFEEGIEVCELWGSWNGWHLNQSIFNPQNVSVLNFSGVTLSSGGNYLWNVRCNDSAGNYGWANSNATFTIYLYPDSPILLNITQSRNDGTGSVTLYWNQTYGALSYRIYYNSTMNGNFGLLGETTSLNFSDNAFNGNVRRFYRIDAWNPVGQNASDKIFGAHVYTLRHNGNTRNWIGFPTNASYLLTANETLNEIINATTVTSWNASRQKRVTCNAFTCPTFPACTDTTCNFEIDVARGYEVNVNGSFASVYNWSLVGVVHTPANLTLEKNLTDFGKYWLGIYANTSLINARTLYGNVTNADAVSRWNSQTQSSQGLIYLQGFGWVGNNFNILLEEGYEVSVNQSVNWTQI